VTHEDIVYDRRVRLIEHAARINNVAEACRTFGVSRKTYYEWSSAPSSTACRRCCPRNAGGRTSPTPRQVDRSASGVAKVLRGPVSGLV
jgi:hypothetical protein